MGAGALCAPRSWLPRVPLTRCLGHLLCVRATICLARARLLAGGSSMWPADSRICSWLGVTSCTASGGLARSLTVGPSVPCHQQAGLGLFAEC